MAKRTAIDEIYMQSEAAGKTAKKKAGTAVRRQSGSDKTVKYKGTYYVSEEARRALEQERHARSMTGRREGSDFSSLVDAAILKLYGRKRGAK